MRRTAVARSCALLLVTALGAACSVSAPQVFGSPAPSSAGASTSRTPTPTTTELSLGPAGYRLTAPLQRSVAVATGARVIIAGGLDASDTTVAGVYSMDAVTGRLTPLGNLPQGVHDAAGAMIGGRLFVFGGGSSTGTDLVQSFDPKAGAGRVVGHLPVPLSDLASASIGSTVFLVGGYDNTRPRPEIYATTDGTTFERVADLPTGLRYPSVTAVSGQLVVAGGLGPAGLSRSVYLVDPASGNVHTVGNLSAPVGHAMAFTLGSTAYVAGGRNASDAAVATVSTVDPSTGSIARAPTLSQPLADAAVAATDHRALLIGGWRGSTIDQVLSARLRTTSITSGAVSTPSAAPAVDAASARPFAGLLLIADRGNDRLLVMNAHKHVVWTYPSPSLPPPAHRFYFPDDAFFVHGGHAILINEEENNVITEIAYPSGRTLWTYGHPGVAGSATGYLHQPDDAYPLPGGGLVVADAKNCRILFLDAGGHYDHQIGTNGVCRHGMPATVGYPNGDTPLPNGHLLISELDGAWVDEVTASGKVLWARQLPGVVEPSDPQLLADGTYMVASYAHPGAVVRFDRSGRVLWYYHPTSGRGELDHPSLAMPLPNGLVAVNDDYRHRVVLIDPATNAIVWQYGTGTPSSGPGQLRFPDGMDLMLPGHVLPLHVDFPSAAVRAGRP